MAAERMELLLAEADRQLAEQRARADGAATRTGLMLSAAALAAAVIGTQLGKDLSVPTLLALILLAAAVVIGLTSLVANLIDQPDLAVVQSWPPNAFEERLLLSKTVMIRANRGRLTWLGFALVFESSAVAGAVIMALIAVARS